MSAIAGIYYLDGRPVDENFLVGMLERLAHRGPNGTGSWVQGSVGLGHRMLWSTPESMGEHLPLADADAGLVITADARIDNREELIEVLGLACPEAATLSDSEIILAAYQEWGEDSPAKLIGDFAFAIWNKREQNLFCARDPVGVKPFYYYKGPRTFVFASEIKALLSVPDVPRRLNEAAVAYHFLAVHDEPDTTFYLDIVHLPAACSLTVTAAGKRLRKYWSLDSTRELHLASDEEYASAFLEVFTEAVNSRLRSAQPVGSMLSGGLDSSSIVCNARESLRSNGSRLRTYSAIFPSLAEKALRRIDERGWIDSVLAMGGVEPYFIRADMISPLAEIETVLNHLDEPCWGPNIYLHWAIYGTARQQGTCVLLEGIDGDSVVSHGYEYLAELFRTVKFRILIREAAALSYGSRRIMLGVIWRLGFKLWLLGQLDRIQWMRAAILKKGMANSKILNQDFVTRIRLKERMDSIASRQLPGRNAREMHMLSITSPLIRYSVEIADKIAAAFQVEPRFPFLDRRLIEFCLALPPNQKLSNGWNRVVMRRAMEGILPTDVQWRRSKTNLGLNFLYKFFEYERERIEKFLSHDSEVLAEYVNIPVLRAAYTRYASDPPGHEQEASTLFRGLVMASWLRNFEEN